MARRLGSHGYRLKLTGKRGYGNLAAGKAVIASSQHKDWPAVHAVDGDKSRGFSTNAAENPAWIMIDLGKRMTVSQIHLYPRVLNDVVGYNFPVDFTVQLSDDNTTWKTALMKLNYHCIRKVKDPNGTPSRLDADDPWAVVQAFPLPASLQARYVRIEATKFKDESRMQFMEIEVYGVDPDVAGAAPTGKR